MATAAHSRHGAHLERAGGYRTNPYRVKQTAHDTVQLGEHVAREAVDDGVVKVQARVRRGHEGGEEFVGRRQLGIRPTAFGIAMVAEPMPRS